MGFGVLGLWGLGNCVTLFPNPQSPKAQRKREAALSGSLPSFAIPLVYRLPPNGVCNERPRSNAK